MDTNIKTVCDKSDVLRFWTAWKILLCCDDFKREALKSIDSAFALWRFVNTYSGLSVRWKRKYFLKNSDCLTMRYRYSDFEKLENTSFSMNNENFYGSPVSSKPFGPPVMIIMGAQISVRCFYGKWKKLNSVFERRSNVFIDYLERGFYVWPNLDGNVVLRLPSPLIFGVDSVDGLFSRKSDLWYNESVRLMVCDCWCESWQLSILYFIFRYWAVPVPFER